MQAGYLGWAFAAGVLIPVMAASNGALTRLTGNLAPVMLSVFAVGLLATAAVTAVSGMKGATALTNAPPYLFCGGLVVAFYVLSVSVLTPRIGVVSTITCAVAGQIVMSAVIDHFGLFGAALLYADGMLTPAISVLSAVEGLGGIHELQRGDGTSYIDELIVPLSVVILVALFWVQRTGTARVGAAFGPVMILWFSVLILMGGYWIAHNPEVLVLVEPTSAVDAHTEARIAARLRAHRAGRTTVVTTVSPLLLDTVDEVAFLVDGVVAATGTHAELLETDSRYRAVVVRDVAEVTA